MIMVSTYSVATAYSSLIASSMKVMLVRILQGIFILVFMKQLCGRVRICKLIGTPYAYSS